MRYIIGIDTGGTCTDAVLMDKNSGAIVTTVKRPTTHGNLAIGTGDALTALLKTSGVATSDIAQIAVSSTLATNSVVENKGAEVALLVIGYVKHFKLPVKAVVFIKGGHDIQGKEEEELDLEYLVNIVHGLKNDVDAYGVCSAMSIKNPDHELIAEKAISMLDPKPVFCSHRVSDVAGMEQRAATAGLHAKLMPLMQGYVQSVKEAMKENNLDCPMTIIAGNGSMVETDHVIEHAGLTVASGPACTAHFGAMQTNEQSLVIDIGGTTTDIAMIKDGKPLITEDGCQIGSWKTHVEAVDMYTGGIGGDSHVHVDQKGEIHVGPTKVTPLSMSENGANPMKWIGNEDASKLVVPLNFENPPRATEELVNFLKEAGATTPDGICKATKYSGITLEKQLERLENRQNIIMCGFTPTDALHVLNRIDIGDKQNALEAAEKLGQICNMTPEVFAQAVINKTQEQIENLAIDYIVNQYWGNSLTQFISSRNEHAVLGVNFSLKIPLIGLGAAARVLLPEIAKKLGTTIFFPENCEVGNAVGAAQIARSNAQ